jgi:MerR family transcriptional regulator/heat shock protein HspR
MEAMGSYPARDLVRQDRPSTALVVWRPRRAQDK